MRPLDPRLVRRAAGIRRLLVSAVVLGLLSAAALVVQAMLLAAVIAEFVVGSGSVAAVTPMVWWLLLIVAFRAGISWAAQELAGRGAAGVVSALRAELISKAARLGPRWRSSTNGGRLATLAGPGLESLHSYLSGYLPALVLSAVVPLSMVVVLLTLDPGSGLIVVLTLPLVPLFMALVGWYTERQTRAKMSALQRLSGHFTDVVAGLPTLKVFGRARAQAAAVRRITDDYRRESMATLRVAFLSSLVLELLATLSVALVAVTVGLRLIGGGLTLQTALTVLILAPEAYLPLRLLGTRFHAAADGVQATAAVLEILEQPVAPPGTRTDIPPAPGFFLRAIEIRSDRTTLGPIEADVPAGRVTVLTGPSGVGKTTVLRMLAGVLEPTTGRLMLSDGTPLPEVDRQAWRSRIAWAGQQPLVRAGTIRSNLSPDPVGDHLLWHALSTVDAGFVGELAQGLDTELGQDGSGLSLGQRQRLSLARVVLRARTAEVILLDEPTAALDADTEQRVLAGLATVFAGRTVVIATHRPAPLMYADHLVELAGAQMISGRQPVAAVDRSGPDVGVLW